jgi:hypothetical protein
MNSQLVCIKDLAHINKISPHAFLFCPKCHSEFSANHSDYFAVHPTKVIMCCGIPSYLMTKKTVYTRIYPKRSK